LLAWFAPFWVYGLLAIPIAIGVWAVVKEPKLDRDGQSLKQYFGGLGRVFKEKGISLGASFLAGTIVLFILFGVLSWYSDVLENPYGIVGIAKGFVLAGPVLLMAITSYVSGTVLQKQIGRLLKALVVIGLILTGGGLFLAAFASRPVPLFLWLSLVGIGNGLVLPALNTLITSAADSRARGAVTAVYGTVRFFGVALGPPTFNLIDRFGQRGFLIAMAILSALVSGVCVFFIDQKRLLPDNLMKGEGKEGGSSPGGRPPGDGEREPSERRPAVAFRRDPDEPGLLDQPGPADRHGPVP
jgi:ACDE family multidrug resistance protein